MNKILGAIAGIAALGFSAANAATVTVSNGGNLTIGNDIGIQVNTFVDEEDISPTGTDANGSFTKSSGIDAFFGSFNITANDGVEPLIQSLSISFYSDMSRSAMSLIDTVQLTLASGLPVTGTGQRVSFNIAGVAGLTTIYFDFTGIAQNTSGGTSADFNIDISAVPVPAALPLLLSGIAGLGFASRRRKKA